MSRPVLIVCDGRSGAIQSRCRQIACADIFRHVQRVPSQPARGQAHEPCFFAGTLHDGNAGGCRHGRLPCIRRQRCAGRAAAQASRPASGPDACSRKFPDPPGRRPSWLRNGDGRRICRGPRPGTRRLRAGTNRCRIGKASSSVRQLGNWRILYPGPRRTPERAVGISNFRGIARKPKGICPLLARSGLRFHVHAVLRALRAQRTSLPRALRLLLLFPHLAEP